MKTPFSSFITTSSTPLIIAIIGRVNLRSLSCNHHYPHPPPISSISYSLKQKKNHDKKNSPFAYAVA